MPTYEELMKPQPPPTKAGWKQELDAMKAAAKGK